MSKRLIDMTPGERRNAVNRALRALEVELQANRERIAEVLEDDIVVLGGDPDASH